MDNNKLGLTAPSVGWSKLSHTIGSEPRLAGIDEEQVLACIGLAVSAHGYAVSHEDTMVTKMMLSRHQVVPAASPTSVLSAASLLVEAGVWVETPEGFDVGATGAIEELRERLERAARAGRASGNARRGGVGAAGNARVVAVTVEHEAPPAPEESPF